MTAPPVEPPNVIPPDPTKIALDIAFFAETLATLIRSEPTLSARYYYILDQLARDAKHRAANVN